MTKKRKAKSVNRENRSPLMKFKLNQEIKALELLLSDDELEAFRKLPQSDRRDVALKMVKQKTERAINDEIIDYFKQLNANDLATVSTSA